MSAAPLRLVAVFALGIAVEALAHDPYVILQPPREVRSRAALEIARRLTPLSLATADFNRDGYPDLVCGYAAGQEGSVRVYFGDPRAFAPVDGMRLRDPFLDDVASVSVPIAADFLATADFDRDGKLDLLVGGRDRAAVYLLSGDGAGRLAAPRPIAMPGRVTALVHEGRDTVIGIRRGDAFAIAIFDDIAKAPKSLVPMTGEVTAIAIGPSGDISFVAGGSLFVFDGEKPAPIALPFAVSAIAPGNFTADPDGRTQFAVAANDGAIHIVSRPRGDATWHVAEERESAGARPLLVTTRISSRPSDDLVVGSDGVRLFYEAGAGGRRAVDVAINEPVAILPMRLGVDVRPGLVVLAKDRDTPFVAIPEAATTWHVTKTADTNDGACDADCSLREAVIAANATAGPQMIVFDLDGTFLLTIPGSDNSAATGDLDITNSVTIAGNNKVLTVISTNYDASCGDCRVFDVNPTGIPGLAVGFNNLRIRNGYENACDAGGGVKFRFAGTGNNFSISDAFINNNQTRGTCGTAESTVHGGAVATVADALASNQGTFEITNTSIAVNASDYAGGGLALEGSNHTANITNVQLSDNTTASSGSVGLYPAGGGIYFNLTNGGQLNINGSSIGFNTSGGWGGGMFVEGVANLSIGATSPVEIVNNTSINSANPLGGGLAMFGAGLSSISHTSILSNYTQSAGGGIYFGYGTVTLDQCTIDGNLAGNGGGFFMQGGSNVTVSRSLISSNEAMIGDGKGGGITVSNSPLTIDKSTIINNLASVSGGGIQLLDPNSVIVMSFSRIAGNGAPSGPALASGSFSTQEVQNNWWGTNSPTNVLSFASASFHYTPFLKLNFTPSITPICPGGSTAVTASFRTNSNGDDVSSNIDVLASLPINFSGYLGTVSPTNALISATPGPTYGTAMTTFNASFGGAGVATAFVDGASVNAGITIQATPVVDEYFSRGTLPVTGVATLTVRFNNYTGVTATGLSFTNNLPSGLVVANPANISSDCVGTVVANSGDSMFSFSGGSLGSLQSCSVSVDVLAQTAGTKNNSTTGYAGSCQGTTGSATIDVLMPPSIAKEFGSGAVPIGGIATLKFTITNPNAGFGLSNVGVTDHLPAGLLVDTPSIIDNQCGGSIVATAGSSVVTLTAGMVNAGGFCTATVRVTGTSAGLATNTTDAVTSENGGAGNTATATITVTDCTYVLSPPSAFFAPPGGQSSVGVQTIATCAWTAISNDSWITTTSSSTGSGVADYTVAPNTTVLSRQGSVRIENQTFSVSQDGVQPFNLVATATTTTSVGLTWTSDNVAGFEIWRNSGSDPTLAPIATVLTNAYTDNNVVADTAYVYAVRAVDSGANASSFTNRDLAVTKFFSEPLVAGATRIKLDHLKEHRSLIDIVRQSAGHTPFAYADAAVPGLRVKASQANELVDALQAAFDSFNLGSLNLPAVSQNQPITAASYNALRDRLR